MRARAFAFRLGLVVVTLASPALAEDSAGGGPPGTAIPPSTLLPLQAVPMPFELPGEAEALQAPLDVPPAPAALAPPRFLPTPLGPAPVAGKALAGVSLSDAPAVPGDMEPASPTAEAYGAFQRGYYLSALRLAEPLANLGDPAAQTLLGEIYARGLGVPRDEKESARWYAIAAKAGVAEAQFRYALLLIEGKVVERDDATAPGGPPAGAGGGRAPPPRRAT